MEILPQNPLAEKKIKTIKRNRANEKRYSWRTWEGKRVDQSRRPSFKADGFVFRGGSDRSPTTGRSPKKRFKGLKKVKGAKDSERVATQLCFGIQWKSYSGCGAIVPCGVAPGLSPSASCLSRTPSSPSSPRSISPAAAPSRGVTLAVVEVMRRWGALRCRFDMTQIYIFFGIAESPSNFFPVFAIAITIASPSRPNPLLEEDLFLKIDFSKNMVQQNNLMHSWFLLFSITFKTSTLDIEIWPSFKLPWCHWKV